MYCMSVYLYIHDDIYRTHTHYINKPFILDVINRLTALIFAYLCNLFTYLHIYLLMYFIYL